MGEFRIWEIHPSQHPSHAGPNPDGRTGLPNGTDTPTIKNKWVRPVFVGKTRLYSFQDFNLFDTLCRSIGLISSPSHTSPRNPTTGQMPVAGESSKCWCLAASGCQQCCSVRCHHHLTAEPPADEPTGWDLSPQQFATVLKISTPWAKLFSWWPTQPQQLGLRVFYQGRDPLQPLPRRKTERQMFQENLRILDGHGVRRRIVMFKLTSKLIFPTKQIKQSSINSFFAIVVILTTMILFIVLSFLSSTPPRVTTMYAL